jgi:hypothetical protein
MGPLSLIRLVAVSAILAVVANIVATQWFYEHRTYMWSEIAQR